MSDTPKAHKAVIIGWDGATFDLMDPWIKEGKLPNIARFMKEGTSGKLQSTVPYFTYPAWTSFLTGKNPGKHGVFDFTERVPGTHGIQFVNAKRVRSKTVWSLLSSSGKRVACMGVPVSYPPESINGALICGFDAPGAASEADQTSMHPPELLNELRENVGPYITSANIMGLMSEDKHEEALKEILSVIDQKAKTALYLLNREAWDVFMVLFGESDLIGHHFWRFTDPNSPLYTKSSSRMVSNAIFEVYKRLDDWLPKILEACPADSIKIICSDHGFGGSGDHVLYMNKWLADNGFLAFRGGGPKAGLKMRIINKAKFWGLRFLPPKVKAYIFRRKQGIANKMESYLRFGGIDWSKTRAFSEELPYLQTIWINVKDREPSGVVEAGSQYDQVVAELKKKLQDWTDPITGEKVVTQFIHRDDVYEGDYKERSPDVLLRCTYPNGYAYQGKSSVQSATTVSIERLALDAPGAEKFYAAKSGTHREFGILAAQGPMIPSGRTIEGARLMDVIPTLMYLLGEPVPEDMDGVVLTKAIDDEFVTKRPLVAGEADTQTAGSEDRTYATEDEELINKRLQELGYLD